MSNKNIDLHAEGITALRQRFGSELTLVGHHYQQENVVRHCDFRGDSLELARRVAHIEAANIVFCGVYFMGESAALLAKSGQRVFLPEENADCVMALMSPATLVDRLLTRLTASGRKLIPLAYVNTALDVKAVVGRHGGAVCTSANAENMLRWAMEQGDGVFFLPDKNLARNTARSLGMAPERMHLLDIRKRGEAADLAAAKEADLVIWPGLCAIHARFNVQHVAAARAAHPGCLVVVHPECSPEVVAASDRAGSTSVIINTVRNAPDGATVVVGTEINLVRRLARESEGRVTVLPLLTSECSHMAKVTPAKLHRTLEQLAKGTARPVHVPPEAIEPAREALERMLQACA